MGSASELLEARPEIEVWAGGGVVCRLVDSNIEVLLIHRPHRDDWSFPKGKLDPDETVRQCARREVLEETGLQCRTGARLAVVEYLDGRKRRKAVVYWAMAVESGRFAKNDEVDAVGWFDLASAQQVLSYRRDVEMLADIKVSVLSSTLSS